MSEGIKDQEIEQDGQQTGQTAQNDLEGMLEKAMAEYDKKNQAEIDRRVSKFLNENKELKEKLDALQSEKMTVEEKAQYELEKAKQEKSQVEQEKIAFEIGLKKMKLATEKGLPTQFNDFINANTTDVMEQQIDTLNNFIVQSVEQQVKRKIDEALASGKKPTASSHQEGQYVYKPGMTQAEIMEMLYKPGFLESVSKYQK